MPKPFTVTATWDPAAQVFTSQSDIPGLVVEAGTFEELIALVEALAPDVIAANLPGHRPPYRVCVEIRHELAVAQVPKDFYRDIVRLLEAAGWAKADGGKGSHEKWIEAKSGRMVIVPRSKSRHTANEVLKQAGLPKAF